MRSSCIILLLVAAMALSPHIANAQSNNWYVNEHNELYLGEGIVSVEEINGWGGRGGMQGYVSTPSPFTGALFLTYRHYFNKWFALGVCGGTDDEQGDLSEGNPRFNGTGSDGLSGHYTVHSYTLAVESIFAYKKFFNFTFYALVGAGASYFEDYYTIFPALLRQVPKLPSNPYNYHDIHYTAQVSPIGLRFGEDVAGFLEFGFGYKGLISGGLSIRF